MHLFKIGQRVKHIGKNMPRYGNVGTITYINHIKHKLEVQYDNEMVPVSHTLKWAEEVLRPHIKGPDSKQDWEHWLNLLEAHNKMHDTLTLTPGDTSMKATKKAPQAKQALEMVHVVYVAGTALELTQEQLNTLLKRKKTAKHVKEVIATDSSYFEL